MLLPVAGSKPNPSPSCTMKVFPSKYNCQFVSPSNYDHGMQHSLPLPGWQLPFLFLVYELVMELN